MSSATDNAALLKKPFRFYFRLHWRPFALGLLSLCITNLIDALPPLVIGRAIDQITGGRPASEVGLTVLLLLALTLGLATARFLWRIFWGHFHHTVAEDLRNRIFDKFTFLGPGFFQRNPVGQLMSLITNDVNSFRMAIGPGVLTLIDALIILCIVPPLMLSISASWTIKTLALMPVVPFFIAKIVRLIHQRYRIQQDYFAEMSGVAQEIVSGVRVIKSYAQEDNQTRLFNDHSRRFEQACNRVAKVDSFFTPVMELGVGFGAVILLFVGAPEVMAGAVSVGSFFAFYQYIQRMIWPMTALGISINMYQQGNASFKRIAELLAEPLDVRDEGTLRPDHFESLEVRNLTFTHTNKSQPSLRNVSFRLEAGQTLGIVGVTGSGKSTLVDLLCRLYSAPPNTIFINGHPIESIELKQLRNLISYVPQEAFLFSEKISENIGLDSATQLSEIENVASLVNIEQEIASIAGGYEAYLGERGVNLSGGQKQRLTIARALVRNSPIIILDDSLSAVDAKTEEKILTQLQTHWSKGQRQTIILVSHRLASLKWADRILVLNKGEVEAFGDHHHLLKTSSTYRSIFELQARGGEVEP